MEVKVILLSIVVGLFAVASAVLGFIAEANKLTASDIRFSSGVCIYPAKPAYELGKYAVALLLVAQIIATLAVGCFSCCIPRAPGVAGALWFKQLKSGICCSIVSWILTAVAVVSYMYGMRWNAATTRSSIELGWDHYCQYLKGAVFRRAALLGLAAALFAISSYVTLRAPPAAEPKPDGQQPAAAPGFTSAGQAQYPQFAPPPPPHGFAAAGQAQYPQFAPPPPPHGFTAAGQAQNPQFAPGRAYAQV
ncbi:hypothetical protein ACP70R_035441 [Stipagrostis hirtigluma subsp. patula]